MGVLSSIATLARLAIRYQAEYSASGWRRVLGDRLVIGHEVRLRRTRLVVRESARSECAIGAGSDVGGTMVLERAGAKIQIGTGTHIGGGTLLDAATLISIGDEVLVSFDVLITDNDSHSLVFDERRGDVARWVDGHKDWGRVATSPVRIANRAWIGARAIILKGVTVGEGAAVGAGSVVTRDVPPWTLAAGNPARVVKDLPRSASGF